MNNKLNKLKEINVMLNNVLKEFEIHMFLENIEDVQKKNFKKINQKTIELK